MRTIKIDTECDSWYLYSTDDWKGYIYCPEDEFDEVFVVVGNKDYCGVTVASWYKKALDYLEENEIWQTKEEIMKALATLYPDDEFDTFTITGYVQGEWQDVIYKINGSEFADDFKETFADFYFGHITELIDETENVHEYVADSELWKHENKDLDEFIRDIFGIDEDEKIKLLKSNGYVSVKSWAEV